MVVIPPNKDAKEYALADTSRPVIIFNYPDSQGLIRIVEGDKDNPHKVQIGKHELSEPIS